MSGPSTPTLRERTVAAVFNRKNAVRIFAAGLLVDQFGYAGEYGGRLLRTNSFTEPAAPYYEGAGAIMNFSWLSLKDLAGAINSAVQGPSRP